ncbi:hypothetical protein RJ639_025459 [Escallonia herrerae]|uniref:4-coumarate--CoA ligase n=1 Tax=Escallonia herrerae TaxID=1293975 RepID=A0AA88RX00_9ASTE|nr:hypothetical protein RJ639_025459 [Escallonia herrerae]
MLSVASAETSKTPDLSITKPPSHSSPNHVFRSKLPDIPISSHLLLHTYCFENMSAFADKACLIEGSTGKTYSYAETHLICRKTAAGLTSLGIKKGDVVMVLLQNCAEFVFALMGASMIGSVITTVNPFYTSAEIFKQFNASKTKLIITQSNYVDKLRDTDDKYPKLGQDFKVITTDDPPPDCLHFSVLSECNDTEMVDNSVSINPKDPVALPFSSGTTGLPKGVILTHRSLSTSVSQQVDGENPNFYLKPDDVVLCVLPLFHIYSLNSALLCSLRAGTAVLLMEKFEIGSLLELIQRHRVSVAAVVPPLVLALAKNPLVDKFDLSSIRMVMSGAAPLGKELEEALRSRIPQATLGQGYGMTEAGPVLSLSAAFAKQPFPTKSGSCGMVVRNAELKVIDPESGCSLGYNQTGEICIRGPQIMKGYLNNDAATSATIDVDGWLHTGDIGYVDDDEEVFIVPPAELEDLLLSHPSITDAAVVPQNDAAAGEVPVAFVVQSKGFELTEETVKEFIAKQQHKKISREQIEEEEEGSRRRKESIIAMSVASVEASQSPDLCGPPPKGISPPPSSTHIFKSKFPDIPISNHLPLHTYCFENISDLADRTCLIEGSTGKTYSYAETHLICQKTAAGLTNLGIKKGDVVMVLLQNCAEFVFTFMGASMIGAVTTTANPFYTTAEIFKQFNTSKAKLIITQSLYVDKLRDTDDNYPKLGHDFKVITVDDPPENCLHFSVLSESNETEMVHQSVSIDPNDAVALPFSSGTTGLPKGVILTHKSLVTSVAQQVDGENPNLYLKSDDVILCVLPLFHIYSLNSVLLCSLRVGAAVLLMQKFEIGSLLELIQRHRVSVAPVVPPLVLALAKNPMVAKFDLSSIRMVLSGAAPLGKELEEALRSRVPQATFAQGYGMTEAGPVLSMSAAFAKQPFPTKSGSCGTVVRNAELKVIDPETGCSLGYNLPGEICIRGTQIMKGYLNDDEATAATIDVDGWLHTGDIGYVDNDEEVFIVDRVKELIKFKGLQAYFPPTQPHSLFTPSGKHPSTQKDDTAGEVPVAFVVRSKGFELTEEGVKEFISKQV